MPTKKPVSTNSNTSWVLTGGAAVHECIDEPLASTDDAASRVTSNTNGAMFSVAMETMDNPNAPYAGSLVIWFRQIYATLVGDPATQSIVYTVKSAGSTVATITYVLNTISTTWTSYSYTFSAAELALITDYNDIDVECVSNVSGGTQARISTIEMVVSDRILRAYLIA